MQKQEPIHIIATGGTIDKVYCPSEQRNIFKSQSGLPNFFKERIGFDIDTNFTQLMMIDSLDMTDQDREKILDTIHALDENRIMITHGTDTMIDTANFIQDRLEQLDKTIVLMGAMIPMDGFYYSDAGFNLGYATACTQSLEAGIYICMNAQIFKPDDVQKNIQKSRFEKKSAA